MEIVLNGAVLSSHSSQGYLLAASGKTLNVVTERNQTCSGVLSPSQEQPLSLVSSCLPCRPASSRKHLHPPILLLPLLAPFQDLAEHLLDPK